MAFPIAAVASGVSALGGLFGKKKSAPQTIIQQHPLPSVQDAENVLAQLMKSTQYDVQQSQNMAADFFNTQMMQRGLRTSGIHARSLAEMLRANAKAQEAARQAAALGIWNSRNQLINNANQQAMQFGMNQANISNQNWLMGQQNKAGTLGSLMNMATLFGGGGGVKQTTPMAGTLAGGTTQLGNVLSGGNYGTAPQGGYIAPGNFATGWQNMSNTLYGN